ncbi:MAG: PEP-CTERM sorting domain-containing protein, partial [Gloeobacteraceae cyanobacterium ES-bin-144]|nr:PEP-CTERM sorting domain-containing protein [Verrucomicrobiales bacterium]
AAAFNAANDGVQYAGNYDNDQSSSDPTVPGSSIYFYQDLGVAFAANSTYTVTLAVGNRDITGNSNDGITQFGLFSGLAIGTDLGTATSVDGDTEVTLNEFAEFSYSFTTGAIAPTGNVVGFFRAIADADGIRASVDNFRVEVEPVPEPSTSLLGALGILGLLGVRRRA